MPLTEEIDNRFGAIYGEPAMSIVEFILFIAAACAIYFFMKPLQRRLQSYLFKFFKSKHRKPGAVIDISDYSKKDKK